MCLRCFVVNDIKKSVARSITQILPAPKITHRSLAPEAMLSSPGDWIYFAEGGKHVIFRHRDVETANTSSKCNASIDHFVLRIRKSDLAAAAVHHHPDSLRVYHYYKLAEIKGSTSSTERFDRLILEPSLGIYLDVHRTLVLPASFCAHLYQATISTNVIPSSRLPSWTTESQCDVTNVDQINATLLRNHTRLKLHKLSPISCKTIRSITMSVEIKPKGGYLATSPLVLPAHRCKFSHSRYYLQQQLMERGFVRKGWHRNEESDTASNQQVFTRSSYSPLDLFSGNFAKMSGALKELSKSMQNNFRVWCDGDQIFGEYETLAQTKYQELLIRVLGTKDHNPNITADAKSTLLDLIVSVVATVLDRETLLEGLLSLQLLDAIDGDGAVLVYRRLVSLCGGSQSEVEKALEQHYLLRDESFLSTTSLDGNSTRDILVSSPYQLPECPHLHKLLNESAEFRSLLHIRQEAVLDSEGSFFNTFHSSCCRHVKHLSKQACIYLLSNWLLSLTMCDVSFFVTFHLSACSEIDETISEIHEPKQTQGSGGWFVCKWDSTSCITKALVQYEIKVIDCDPKPVAKLRSREDVEKMFQFCS